MVRSAQGDYHAMMKLLREDPRLSKHRDFTSGFTALHWAAKHGESFHPPPPPNQPLHNGESCSNRRPH